MFLMFRRQVARQIAIGAAVVLAGMSMVGMSATAQPGSAGRSPTDCVVPDDAALQVIATETSEGYISHQEWVANPAAQQVVGAVNRAVGDTFGHPNQVSARDQLERGLIGSALDHHTQTVVVVVDPSRVDQHALRGRLHGTVAQQRAESGGRLPGLQVEVRAGCSSTKDLLAAQSVLAERNWHPDAGSAKYFGYLNAADSTYHVSFGEKDRAVAESLRQVLGHRATVTVESASSAAATQAGRFDDPAPHWGGANIYASTGEIDNCTSGFTAVEKEGGKRQGSVTAGHCSGKGVNMFSGSQDFGEVVNSLIDTSRDMAFITSTLAHPTSYSHFLYVDPGTPDIRHVVGQANPALHNFVCVSGSMTGARCNIEVNSIGGGFSCDDRSGICTFGLDTGRRPGVAIVQRGDSGAPVYFRTADDGAIIRGLLVGGNVSETNPTGDTIGFHRISQVEDNLKVTVSTG
jgi:hypothetical protein